MMRRGKWFKTHTLICLPRKRDVKAFCDDRAPVTKEWPGELKCNQGNRILLCCYTLHTHIYNVTWERSELSHSESTGRVTTCFWSCECRNPKCSQRYRSLDSLEQGSRIWERCVFMMHRQAFVFVCVFVCFSEAMSEWTYINTHL